MPRKKPNHEDTEYYSPVPPVVTPGNTVGEAPSDAIILFDGKNLDQWINTKDSTPAKWILADNVMTVNKSTGDIQTRSSFTDFQLHLNIVYPETLLVPARREATAVYSWQHFPGEPGDMKYRCWITIKIPLM